jgi:predicted phosphoribosyltransferase
MPTMTFRDREDAARRLAEALSSHRGENPLILAIPRGAVPMGKVLAEELGGELDVVLVHKLGAPGNPEYAIGAVTEAGQTILTDTEIVLPADYLERETARQLATLRERRARFTPDRAAADPCGRVVIVVDDGIATGSTLRAALTVVRAQQPRRLIAAVGVAPKSSLPAVEKLADEVVCLAMPSVFVAVGQFFRDFRQIEDAEVVEILRQGRAFATAAGGKTAEAAGPGSPPGDHDASRSESGQQPSFAAASSR